MGNFLVTPALPPTWHGGFRYYQTLNKAMTELEQERLLPYKWNRVEFPLEIDLNLLSRPSLSTFLKLIDYLRSVNGVSFPVPITRYKKRSFKWIPDLQDIELPEMFSESDILARKKSIIRSINLGHTFYFSSNHSKHLFIDFYGQEERVAGVARFTVPSWSQSKNKLERGLLSCARCDLGDFFYLPNQWWKHKNHLLALESFQQFRESGGESHLVLTGSSRDSRHPQHELDLKRKIDANSGIHYLGVVSSDLQSHLFRNSICVIQPSLYEGWSTTIEEALSHGAGIIASNLVVNREQLEGVQNAIFFDPLSPESLTNLFFNPPSSVEFEMAKAVHGKRWKRFKEDILETIARGLSIL